MSSKQEESANYRSSYEGDEQASDAQNVNYKREKPEHRAENRLEKFQEALDHTAAGDGEKADFNRKVAEDFRNETNILQYPPEERLKYMEETYVEGFNEMDHPSFKERANAAKDIAQSTFKPVYNEFEAVEANNAEKIPDDLRKIFDKEKITEFKYNDETGNIEFDFKDMKQLERIAKKANRQVHVVRMDSSGGDERGAGSDEKHNSGSGPSPDAIRARERAAEREKDEETEHRTAWMTTQEDQSISDAKRRKEIERAMNDFTQALLWSHKYTEEKAEKMAEALERGAKYVDMPEREIDQQNNFKNMETLDTEELEHRVDGMVQQNWDGVYEAIDKVAAEHPEEAQSLRYAADAMKAAYAESIIEDFKNDRKDGEDSTAKYDDSVAQMERSAKALAEDIGEGRAILDSSRFSEDHAIEFTEEADSSMENLQDIHDRANQYIINSYAEPPMKTGETSQLNTDERAVEKLIEDLASGIEYINQNEPAIMNGEQYDGGSLNAMYESASNRARALQHMMGTRNTTANEEEESRQPVAA